MSASIFRGRSLVIATNHGKEQAIRPILETLGVKCIIPSGLDTDQFGTFTGEIERIVDPLEAARLKCELACQAYGCSLAVASEGSFGPHPSMFFIPADDEIVILRDLENKLEIKAREISTKTNFSGRLCQTWEDAESFAAAALFPEHALIARISQNNAARIVKGIKDWKHLKEMTGSFLADHGSIFLETDMRAMHNPSRMKVIASATVKLLETIQRLCPGCGMPGFDIQDIKAGLPCGHCGAPTRSTLARIYECQKCLYRLEQAYPNGKEKEDPMYCDWCNP